MLLLFIVLIPIIGTWVLYRWVDDQYGWARHYQPPPVEQTTYELEYLQRTVEIIRPPVREHVAVEVPALPEPAPVEAVYTVIDIDGPEEYILEEGDGERRVAKGTPEYWAVYEAIHKGRR